MKSLKNSLKSPRTRNRARPAWTAAWVVAVATAGCADDPFAPETGTPVDVPALQAALLIGNSPLEPASDPAVTARTLSDGSVERALEVRYQVSVTARGDGSGRYVIRTSAEFYGSVDPKDSGVVDPKNDPVAGVDPKDNGVAAVDPKDGGVALVVIARPIDKGSWAAIEKSSPKMGDLVDVVVTAELILVADDGSETPVDRVTTEAAIDPKDIG